jgi:hypothetical protein
MFGLFGTTGMWIGLAVLLVATCSCAISTAGSSARSARRSA